MDPDPKAIPPLAPVAAHTRTNPHVAINAASAAAQKALAAVRYEAIKLATANDFALTGLIEEVRMLEAELASARRRTSAVFESPEWAHLEQLWREHNDAPTATADPSLVLTWAAFNLEAKRG